MDIHKDFHITIDDYNYLLDVLNGNSEWTEKGKTLKDYYGITKYNDEKLYVGDKLLIPNDIEHRNAILNNIYSKFPAGRDKLYSIITDEFIGISRRDIATYLNHNSTHQILQIPSRPKTVKPIITTKPFSHIELDLGDTILGKETLLLIQDHFTKYIKGYFMDSDMYSFYEKRKRKGKLKYVNVQQEKYDKMETQFRQLNKDFDRYRKEDLTTYKKLQEEFIKYQALKKKPRGRPKKKPEFPDEPEDEDIGIITLKSTVIGNCLKDYLREVENKFKINKFYIVHTDNGASFLHQEFQSVCVYEGIKHVSGRSYKPTTQGLIERGMRTIKSYLARISEQKEITEDNIQDIINEICNYYNNSKHETTKYKPNIVATNNTDISNNVHQNIVEQAKKMVTPDKIIYKIGDKVRITLLRNDDYMNVGKDKETLSTKRHYIYSPMWSEEIYYIVSRKQTIYDTYKYYLVDNSNTPVFQYSYEHTKNEKGFREFYGYQLQKSF